MGVTLSEAHEGIILKLVGAAQMGLVGSVAVHVVELTLSIKNE